MGVWAPVSSVTPGCSFHLPHRNSPCPRSHSPEKGKAASNKCLSGITAEPLQYGDGVVYLPAICTGSSGRGAAACSQEASSLLHFCRARRLSSRAQSGS